MILSVLLIRTVQQNWTKVRSSTRLIQAIETQKRFTSRIKLEQFANMSYVDHPPKVRQKLLMVHRSQDYRKGSPHIIWWRKKP